MRRARSSLFASLAIVLALLGGLLLLRRAGRGPDPGRRAPEAPGAPAEDEPAAARVRAIVERGMLAGEDAGSGASEAAREARAEHAELPVSIEGRIADPDGAPIAGARVSALARADLDRAIARHKDLLDRDPLEALRAIRRSLEDLARRLPGTSSGEDGRYALRGLPEGDHRVLVAHEDSIPHKEEHWILVESGKRARYDVELLPGHRISGFVRDASGRPVPGALVHAEPVERGRLKGFGKLVQIFVEECEGALLFERGPSVTDARGAFRTSAVEPGLYDLRAAKDGYRFGELREIPSDSEGVLLTLAPAIRVSGRVLSPGGTPVSRVEVVLAEPVPDLQGPDVAGGLAFLDLDVFSEKARRAETDEEGRFALEAFATGSYELVLRAAAQPELRERVEVEAPAVDLGDIVLSRGDEIAGAVVSPDGLPVPGAEVWVPKPSRGGEDPESRALSVLGAGPSSSLARAKTDGGGAFRLAGLASGLYEVAVLAEGHPGRVVEGIATGDRNVAIALECGLSARGLVVDAETGEPLAGARVDVPWDPAPAQTTGEDGRFELVGLRRGRERKAGAVVRIRVALDGYREAQATAASADPSSASLDAGEIQLRRLEPGDSAPLLSGVVRDREGRPIGGARVWVEVPGWPLPLLRMGFFGQAKEVRTGPDGSFSVEAPQAPEASFEVLAAHPGHATSRAGPFPRDRADEWPFLEIELGEGAALEGRVTGPDGAPLPGARVRIWRDAPVSERATPFVSLLPQSSGPTAYAGRDGSFALRRIEPGTYWVEASAPGCASKRLGPLAIGIGPRGSSGDIPPARVEIALEGGARLEGRVVDPGGRPVARVEVVAFAIAGPSEPSPSAPPPDPEEDDEIVVTGALGLAAALTGEDGRYGIEHLPRGEFRVLARARGYEPAWLLSAVPGEPQPDLVLAPLGRISGRVRDASSGAPISRFWVRLDRKDPEGVYREDHAKARWVEDAGGRFSSGGLRAGSWRVRIAAGGRLPAEVEAELEPGGEVSLEVLVRPGCWIRGRVATPEGAPFERAEVYARREGERRDSAGAETGPDGTFELAGLEEGPYEIRASHPEGYAEGSEGRARVEVSYEKGAEVVLVLRPAGGVLGRIRGLERVPGVADAFGAVFRPVGREGSLEAGIDELGCFQRDGLRPGRYRIQLFARRWDPFGNADTYALAPEEEAWEIEVRAGELATFEAEAP